MAIIAIFQVPGMTQASYEEAVDRITGGRGLGRDPGDWPVPGLISHAAGPSARGWFVADVWESEEAFRKFGEILAPIVRDTEAPDLRPMIYQLHNLVMPKGG